MDNQIRTETLVESQRKELRLTRQQAEALADAGRRLASQTTWWGAPGNDDEDEDDDRVGQKSVIGVRHVTRDGWSVIVRNAIGLVSIGDLQLEVQPKIRLSHLLYLFEQANVIPRLDEQTARAAKGDAFWTLLARWYLTELEHLIRRDLVRDYQHHEGTLAIIRGRLNVAAAAGNYYRGRLKFECEFDDFNIDTPLNRTLKAAARLVASIPTLDALTRRRASASTRRMESVGSLRPADVRAEPARNSNHYRRALVLARHLLSNVGRLPEAGSSYSRTFLISTPRPVEKGILAVLRRGLGHRFDVRPRSLRVAANVTLNPDIVFDHGFAIADVKYKLTRPDWVRTDLYQNVAFATAFRTFHGSVITFGDPSTTAPNTVRVGDVSVTRHVWPTDEQIDPAEAATTLVASIAGWLDSIPHSGSPRPESLE